VATPTFHVFEMYKPHQAGRGVRIKVEVPQVGFRAEGKDRKLFRIAGSASIKDKDLTLTLVHTHISEPAEISIRLRDGKPAEGIQQTVLTHEKLNAHNTFENPKEVMPKTTTLKSSGPSIKCVIPAASITRLDLKLI